MEKFTFLSLILFLSNLSFGQNDKSCNKDFNISGVVSLFSEPNDSSLSTKETLFIKRYSSFRKAKVVFSKSDGDTLCRESCSLLYNPTNKKYYIGYLISSRTEAGGFKMRESKIWSYVVSSWAKVHHGKTNISKFTLVDRVSSIDSKNNFDYCIYSLDNVFINGMPIVELIQKSLELQLLF